MKRWIGVALALALLGGLAVAGQGQVGADDGAIPGRYIVVLWDDVDADLEVDDIERKHGVLADNVFRHALKGFVANMSSGKAKKLEADPRVAFVEPDRIVTAFQTLPNGVDRIQADVNTTAGIDGVDNLLDVDIAIIDTGIQPNHPDLRVSGGVRILGGVVSTNFADDNGHGTHVAGTAAAIDNLIGVVGVAPGARLWAVKVLDRRGSGFMSDVIAGVDWVTARAATIEVANMSLGCFCTSDALNIAISKSVAAGVVYAVAAGNSTADAADFSPANHPDVLAVSAIVDTDGQPGGLGPTTAYGNDDTFASFSNFGSVVDIAAPGVNILSTYRGSTYATMSGTSMASPHVAGALAINILANGRNRDVNDVINGSDAAAIRSAVIAAGAAQAGPFGFSGDRDAFPEPLVFLGTLGPPPTLASITVTPNLASVAVGSTVQLTATGTFSDGSTQNLTSSATWSSSSTIVATITSGLVAGVMAGTATITATSGAVSGNASVTVTTPPTLVSIAVAPTGASITVGGTQQFAATGTFSDGSTQNLTSTATWSSSNTVVATINASGMATGMGAGTADITATKDGIVSSPATLTVTAAPAATVTVVSVTAANVDPGKNYNIRANVRNDGSASVTITVRAFVEQTGGTATQQLANRVVTIAPGATVRAQFRDTPTVGPGNYKVTITVVEDPDVGLNNTATFAVLASSGGD